MHETTAAQQASWDRFSPGWKRWDEATMAFLAPQGEAIVAALAGATEVLDIAAGTGEPAASLARAVGRVVVTDLSERMLELARAKLAGATNVELQQADACALPFADARFTGVSCRLGLMFVADLQGAANEMKRVLAPGGRIAVTVWGPPEKNPWATTMMQLIGKHVPVPQPQPNAPGLFRCARPGAVAALFAEAGLDAIEEREVPCVLDCGGPDGYWGMMTEVAAPAVASLSGTDDATRARIKADLIATVAERFPSGAIPGSATLITARR